MRQARRRLWMAIAVVGLALLFLGAWSVWSRAQGLQTRSVLAAAVSPSLPAAADGVVYVRQTLFELEGVPLAGGPYQPLTTTYELWVDGLQPTRFRQTITDDPGGLRYAKVSDAATVWEYGLDDRRQAIRRAITDEERQAAASLAAFPCCALSSPARWASQPGQQAQVRSLGSENMGPWGEVQAVAIPWDGVTASTDLYHGRPHTIVITTALDSHWVVGWQDIVHAPEGDVQHRVYRLEALEVLAPDAVPADLFAFTPPDGVTVRGPAESTVAAQPVATPGAATIVLAGHTVTKFAFTPWLPAYVPAGFRLKSVTASASSRSYLLQYENNAERLSLHIRQGLNLRYNWGAAPERVDLPQAEVELGTGAPTAPSWLIARVHLKAAIAAPDFLVESSMGWDEMKKVILSLQPVK